MRIGLYQPDIPQNAGAIFRLAACLGVSVDIIEPLGFVLDDRRVRRVAMDYGAHVQIDRHASWDAYCTTRADSRKILLTTTADTPYFDFKFCASDTLLVGRESAGAPDKVHHAAHTRLIVPMAQNVRSLNVVTAAAIVLGEAMRQVGGFSSIETSSERVKN